MSPGKAGSQVYTTGRLGIAIKRRERLISRIRPTPATEIIEIESMGDVRDYVIQSQLPQAKRLLSLAGSGAPTERAAHATGCPGCGREAHNATAQPILAILALEIQALLPNCHLPSAMGIRMRFQSGMDVYVDSFRIV
jgi:hypothetical protein